MDVRSLVSDGFVRLMRPPALQGSVEDAMNAWRRFCTLEKDEKLKVSGGDRIIDVGYMLRQDSGSKADNKEQFHLAGHMEQELRAKAKAGNIAAALDFIDSGDALIHAIRPTIRHFASDVEEAYKMPGFTAEVMGCTHLWTFRFLHYFGGEMLANSHADRLGFTLHLTEDAEGGEYLCIKTRRWKPWPVDDHQTIIFPSIGLQHRSNCQLTALWHRVVPTPITKVGGRYAMVAFIDFPQIRAWDKFKYQRVQDQPEGFNYGMSFEQLDAFFAPSREAA